ncbi:short-chain dehydrogenase/reductase 3 [Petromyzon marinus]|uniref:Short-chain dehydrogenase/reductase 3 n=1 Tax=Petromyzon marinus TaxID=7757 RepID=A0AAJ7X7M1_PETMA|nr:short-chain dehydrogenase/reductase 3 [Petromyzon marinus]
MATWRGSLALLALLVLLALQTFRWLLRALLSPLWTPTPARDLSGDVVLITGGGRGIGRQLALEFARQGVSKVVLWGRTESCLRDACHAVRSLGTECHYTVCDVANREQVYREARAVRDKVGDVSILVNNAGVVHGKPLLESDDDALLKTQHINVLAQFWTLKAFVRGMLERGSGHVVSVSSVLALAAIPGATDYCASKAAGYALAESLALGLSGTPGVRATTVLPYHTSTDMFRGMQPRFPWLFPPLEPETVARRTVQAVREGRAFLLLPWTMNFLIIMKSILPQPALDEIYKFTGSYTCMQTFKGRG